MTDRKAVILRVVQVLSISAVLWFGGRLLVRHWADVRALQATLTPAWGRVAWSALIVLVSYGVLIATWRGMVAAWGRPIPLLTATRIWFVSNLGRYVPGKVWQIGAMGVMAHGAGVGAPAAVGSSLVIALVNILVGFGVVAATGAEAFALLGADAKGLWAPMLILLLIIATLPWTIAPLVRFTGRVTGRPIDTPALPAAAVWLAAVGCTTAWVLYGLAFRELSVAILGPDMTGGAAALYVAVFTLSYLAGFLALFAPGGIGVREVAMGALLVGTGLSTAAEASILVVASRLWLTVLEILPGLLFLAWRQPHRAEPTAS